MEEEIAKSVAYGDTDPVSLTKFDTKENELMIVQRALKKGNKGGNGKRGFKGKNIFSNNFGGKGSGQGFNFRHGGANFQKRAKNGTVKKGMNIFNSPPQTVDQDNPEQPKEHQSDLKAWKFQ